MNWWRPSPRWKQASPPPETRLTRLRWPGYCLLAAFLALAVGLLMISPTLASQPTTDCSGGDQCVHWVRCRLPCVQIHGDAHTWNEQAEAEPDRYAVVSDPEAGAVAVWEANTADADEDAGHVAVVEAVLDDGSFCVSEWNWLDRSWKNDPVKICATDANLRRLWPQSGISFFVCRQGGEVSPQPELPELKATVESFTAIAGWYTFIVHTSGDSQLSLTLHKTFPNSWEELLIPSSHAIRAGNDFKVTKFLWPGSYDAILAYVTQPGVKDPTLIVDHSLAPPAYGAEQTPTPSGSTPTEPQPTQPPGFPTQPPTCPALESVSFTPTSGARVGDSVTIQVKTTPGDCFRAARVLIDGSVLYELGAPEFSYTWNTSGYASGRHIVGVEVAAKEDPSWSRAVRREVSYYLTQPTSSPTPGLRIEDLSFDPSSPAPSGTIVRVHARTTSVPTFRAMRLLIDGQIVYELGAPEFTWDWNTSGYGTGDHNIRLEVAAQGDNSWLDPSVQTVTYRLSSAPVPTPAPTVCSAPPIEDLSFSPGSPSNVGTTIRIHAKATWNNCFRAMRLKIDGTIAYELGAPEFTWDWSTSGYGAGDHNIRLEVAAQGDDSWSNPSAQRATYRLTSAPAATPTPTICFAPPIEDLSFNPGSPSNVGTTVRIHAKAAWNSCFRAMRLKIDGNIVYELGAPEFTWDWNTSGYGAGDHNIRLEVAAQGDNSWSHPSVQTATYRLTSAPAATPTPTICSAPPIEDLSFNPGSPSYVGTTVRIHAKATWNSCFRAMRLKIDGNIVYELGAPEFTWDWKTSGYGAGDHNIRLEVAAQGDNSWSNPSAQTATYRLASAPTSTPTPPSCSAPPVEDLSFNPGSPSNVGTTVRIHAKATWNSCFRAMRLKIDGSIVYELGAPEFTYDWSTSGYGAGDHNIRLEVAAQGDNSWHYPSVRTATYRLN